MLWSRSDSPVFAYLVHISVYTQSFVFCYSDSGKSKSKKTKELTEEELNTQREARLQAQANNPHYLKLGASSSASSSKVIPSPTISN